MSLRTSSERLRTSGRRREVGDAMAIGAAGSRRALGHSSSGCPAIAPGSSSPRFSPANSATNKLSSRPRSRCTCKGSRRGKVTHVVEQLCGVSVSVSEVSALVKKLDAELAAWRSRSLAGQACPYIVFDAHVEQVRREGHVRATATLWVIGIRADGYREHLGCWLGASESGESWTMVLEDLVRRGLTGV